MSAAYRFQSKLPPSVLSRAACCLAACPPPLTALPSAIPKPRSWPIPTPIPLNLSIRQPVLFCSTSLWQPSFLLKVPLPCSPHLLLAPEALQFREAHADGVVTLGSLSSPGPITTHLHNRHLYKPTPKMGKYTPPPSASDSYPLSLGSLLWPISPHCILGTLKYQSCSVSPPKTFQRL